MISAELQKAIDCLQLNDVYLHAFVARCEGEFDPKYADADSLAFQSKHFVKKSNVVESENKNNLLQVYIEMGARWVDEESQGDDLTVCAVIEAEYIAEYMMTEPLDQASIDTFSLNNASYHVWPYWRELLSAQCSRMHLPRVILPSVQLAQNREKCSE